MADIINFNERETMSGEEIQEFATKYIREIAKKNGSGEDVIYVGITLIGSAFMMDALEGASKKRTFQNLEAVLEVLSREVTEQYEKHFENSN